MRENESVRVCRRQTIISFYKYLNVDNNSVDLSITHYKFKIKYI